MWFWLLSSGGLVAAFCVSGLGIQYDPVSYQGHYVDGLWFVLAALLPIGLLHPGVLGGRCSERHRVSSCPPPQASLARRRTRSRTLITWTDHN